MPRKQRNQPSKTDDIEFAAEITTSLLGQVRHLQGVLAERDETLKAVTSEKSRLEYEAEGFSQRLRSLDESEQRYKDENWNLETQMQDSSAAAREAVLREQKLQQSLTFANSEKNSAQRELDDLKQDHARITDDHALVRKNHESELASLRKSVNLGESEKDALQRKVEELTSQNQELANGLAGRFRNDETEPETDVGKSEDYPLDLSEREHSPPPSPTKGGQRHSMLESETLKSSLHHAHRMIQSLKGNVHREKSEKLDLKRLLQEARDELEIRKAEPHEKRLKSKSHTDIRKAGRPGLGAARNSRTDVLVHDLEHDPEWEDHSGADTPSHDIGSRTIPLTTPSGHTKVGDNSDAYQTANETEDAFETAEERDTTDNDAFQTGAESMAGDSSEELTETEGGPGRSDTLRGKTTSPLNSISTKRGDRRSIQSTASTSDDEPGQSVHTPLQGQPQRFRSKMNRSSRRSRVSSSLYDSNPSTAKNSPASFVNGAGNVGQSLYNELENLSGDENQGTPSKGSITSPRSIQSLQRSFSHKRSSSSMRRTNGSQPPTPSMRPTTMVYAGESPPPMPKLPTVDSGMMTEPWEPASANNAERDSVPISNPQTSATLPASSAAAITGRIFGSSPYTTPIRDVVSRPASRSRFGSRSSSTSSQPRPVWDQPLQFSGAIPGFGQSTDSTPLSTRSATSQAPYTQDTTSDAQQSKSLFHEAGHTADTPKHNRRSSAITPPSTSFRSQQTLALSPIQSLDTAPLQSIDRSFQSQVTGAPDSTIREHKTTDSTPQATSSGGLFGSMLGWNRAKATVPATAATSDSASQQKDSQRTFYDSEVSPGQSPIDTVAPDPSSREVLGGEAIRAPVYMADQGAQTLLSSEHIDSLLTQRATSPISDNRKSSAAAVMKPLSAIGAVSLPVQDVQDSSDTPRVKPPEMVTYKDSLGKTFKRPASASSMRSRTATSQYPPLPPDHQEAIAAAASRAPSVEPGSMGPPLAPASAYIPKSTRSRTASRPQTPSQQGYPSPSSKGGTTPRAGRYTTTRSQVSRRSSVSSFASELDERFNIRTDGMPMPHGVSPNTDPRMIQAITQTMIGEMMWKYTRKAGRGEMSSTRHRRFFWVHPYTRTLYWSDRDPASADRAQLKSKSVAIEAVRVVTDDNPMPPGLHRKSLIIVTPGRAVQFTAQTSQRHETWFNALSYLLLRTGPEGTTNATDDFTDTDVGEFNPSYSRRASGSRVSLASFSTKRAQNRQDKSRLSSRVGPPVSASAHQNKPAPVEQPTPSRESVRSRISRSLSRSRGSKLPEPTAATNYASDTNEKQGSVASRRSTFMGSVRNSMRSRSSIRQEQEPPEPGVLEGGRNVVSAAAGDSAEDLRRVIEEREQGGRLENVRSCCDGKF